MGEGDEDIKLRSSLNSSLTLASEKKFRSISIPAISSAIFGFPKDRCAKIQVGEAKKYLPNNATSLEIIEFCIIDDETIDYFKKEFEDMNN